MNLCGYESEEDESGVGTGVNSTLILVTTTFGSSATGVELTTDDCRQSVGLTDENSFFLLFDDGIPFFLGFFFLTQKW